MQLVWRDKSLETTMPHEEAVRILESKKNDNDFARKLAYQYRKRGSLTDPQLYWVHKLATEPTEVKLKEEYTMPKSVVDFLYGYLLFASDNLKHPKVRFLLTPIKFGENSVRYPEVEIKILGEKSRYKGKLGFTARESWACFDSDGKLHCKKGDFPFDDVIKCLVAVFEKDDPFTEYGKVTGNCNFCRKTLSVPESLYLGYGKICAKRFGLKWGGTNN